MEMVDEELDFWMPEIVADGEIVQFPEKAVLVAPISTAWKRWGKPLRWVRTGSIFQKRNPKGLAQKIAAMVE